MNPTHFIGKVIGNYKIKEKIGEGAFSTVFLAVEHKDISKSNEKKKKQNFFQKIAKSMSKKRKHYVACKVIPKKKLKDEKKRNNLFQEIRINQRLHHSNVVQLLDVLEDTNYYYIFLEYCPCGELHELLYKKRFFTEYEAAIFMKQLLVGLQYIHSMNVGHRDLKPENILIDEYGRIKISDFGLSKLLEKNDENLTNTPCGSPCYVSPECISGLPYDPKKNDIWSCGVILYEMTTGKLPWTKKNQAKLFKQIIRGEYNVPSYLSDSCSDLIRRLMTVDNKKRITIEEALNHPFLKEIPLLSSNLDRKYVSLRKVDRLVGKDENFEYYNMIPDNLFISQTEMTFVRTRKCIESDEEKKINREKINEMKIEKHEIDDVDKNNIKKMEDSNNDEKKKNNKKKSILTVLKGFKHKKNSKRKNTEAISTSNNKDNSKVYMKKCNDSVSNKTLKSQQIPIKIVC